MTTIIDIIKCENDYATKCMNFQYEKIKTEYESNLKERNEELNRQYWILSKNKNELPKSEKEYKEAAIKLLVAVIVIISVVIGLIFELIFIEEWLIEEFLWQWLSWLSWPLSIVICIFSGFLCLGLMSSMFKVPVFVGDEPIKLYKSKKENLFMINQMIETYPKDIEYLESKVKQLKSNYPKIEDLKNFYYSKEFYEKIEINKLLKEQGKIPMTEITTNR